MFKYVGKVSGTDSIHSQISPKTSPGAKKKKTAQNKTPSKTSTATANIQVNRYFPYRRSSVSLIFNIYFYLFSIFISNKNITKHNHTPHLKHQRAKTEEPPWDGQQ